MSMNVPPPSVPLPVDRKRLGRGAKAVIIAVLVVVAGAATYAVYEASRPASSFACPKYSATGSAGEVEVPNNATLISLAKSERTVKWITTANSPNATEIAHDFTCDFPWANVEVDAVTSGSDVETAVAGEFAGNDHTLDVVSTSLSAITYLNSSGDIQPYLNPVALANYPTGTYDPSGVWVTLYQTPYGIAYNTQEVTGSAIPTNWSALTGSTFDNQIAMDSPATLQSSGTTFAGLYLGLGNATWWPLMKGIAANHPAFATSSETAISYVVEGLDKLAVGVAYSDVFQAVASGGPVAFQWLDPTPVSPTVASVVAHAPHPYMAELFEQWLVSGHGQTAWASTGRSSVLGGGLVVPSGITLVPVTNIYGSANETAWQNTFTEIFGSS